jgi:hypothetical protein
VAESHQSIEQDDDADGGNCQHYPLGPMRLCGKG